MCQDIKRPAALVEGTGSFLQPPFSPLMRTPLPLTVGFHEKQSHQHLLFIIQTTQKWGGKEKKVGWGGTGRGGEDLCVPAELNSISAWHSARDIQVLNKLKQVPAKMPRKTANFCKRQRICVKTY